MDLIVPPLKKYKNDLVLQMINKKFITLDDEHVKDVNKILHSTLHDGLIRVMREDSLFNDVYRNIIYAGSFYKGTKVGKPDEYDFELVIKLPLNYKLLKIETDESTAGYVRIKVSEESKLAGWQAYAGILNNWLDREGYLDHEKCYRWMEGVLTKSFTKFRQEGNSFVSSGSTSKISNFRKTGPAFTIDIYTPWIHGSETTSVDVVPCLEFTDIALTGYRYIPNFLGTEIPRQISVVAKPLPRDLSNINPSRYWRLSYYEQEKAMLSRVGELKPIIRFLKKLRDSEDWKNLSSYFIETVVLHEAFENRNDGSFLRRSQVELLVYMLNKLKSYMDNQKLPYFWNQNYNLLYNISPSERQNYSYRINRILKDIQSKIHEDDFIIAKYILNTAEYNELVKSM